MSRKPKKYHYIYKTTCTVTGKFYVGMHSSDSLEDGYLGSGKILGYSRRKYGDENHVREILEFCSSRDELKQREKEIVNEELLADPFNINLKYGGDGGGRVWNEAHAKKFHRAGWEAMTAKKDLSAASKKGRQTMLERGTVWRPDMNGCRNPMFGKKHSSKARLKMSDSHRGNKNSNFGKRNACITKDGVRKRIPLEMINEYIFNGWSRGLK